MWFLRKYHQHRTFMTFRETNIVYVIIIIKVVWDCPPLDIIVDKSTLKSKCFQHINIDQKQKVLNIFGKDKTAGFELTTYRLVVCALNHCLILLFRYEVRHNMDVSQTTLNIIFWYSEGFILIYNEESETSKLESSILRTFKNALPFPPKSIKPNPTLTFNYTVSLHVIVWNFINIQLLLFPFKFLFFFWDINENQQNMKTLASLTPAPLLHTAFLSFVYKTVTMTSKTIFFCSENCR